MDALYKLGVAFLTGPAEEGRAAAEEAAGEGRPKWWPREVALARALRLSGDTEKARALLDGSIAMYPEESTCAPSAACWRG